jgi:predicted kinase
MVMTEARLILICGLPGSGKTTLAKQLAAEVPAVRICPDEWKHDLGIDYYDEPRRVNLENRLWRLGQELLTLRYLEAPVEELWRRLELRNEEAPPGAAPIKREDLQKWALQFEAPDAAELALFDEAGFSAPC